MSNVCLKQSEGLMTSAAHPYPNFLGQSDDSVHIELLKISEKWNKEHQTGKHRIPTPAPPPPPTLKLYFQRIPGRMRAREVIVHLQ